MTAAPPMKTSTHALIDSHCHLDFAAFDKDRNDVIARCEALGISDIVIPGVTAATWENLLNFCEQHTPHSNVSLHCALGMHPIFLSQHLEEHITRLDALLAARKVVAVGEIGLDFFLPELDQTTQIHLFEQQLFLAKKHDLPVILHTRKSHDKTLSILKKHCIRGGIAHAFNGSMQQARSYLDLGFKLGFGGMLTFQRSRKLRQLAKELPLEAIVLETDSPDMTVEPHHGERNSPEYIPFVLEALTEIRTEKAQEIAAITTANTRSILSI